MNLHVCVDISVSKYFVILMGTRDTFRECKILVSCHDKLILGKRLSVDFMTEIISLMFAVCCMSLSVILWNVQLVFNAQQKSWKWAN